MNATEQFLAANAHVDEAAVQPLPTESGGAVFGLFPQLAGGKVRVLASAAPRRGTGLQAGIPTWREQGVSADYVSYNGVLLPAGVDAEQIRFWEEALRKVAESSEWRAMVEKSGNQPMFKGYVDSHRYLEAELAETRALVSALGLGAA